MKYMKRIVFQILILRINFILNNISHLPSHVLHKSKNIIIQFRNKIIKSKGNHYYNEFLFYICNFFKIILILIYLFYLLFTSLMFYLHNLYFILQSILIYNFYVTSISFCFVY